MNPISYGLSAIILALSALCAGQAFFLQQAKGEITSLNLKHEQERAEATGKLLEIERKYRAAERQHNAQQQATVTTYESKLQTADSNRRTAVADADRLRTQLRDYTSRAPGGDPTDPATCQRNEDRLAAVGGLLAEGVELVTQCGSIVERRDAEVKVLKDIVEADRATLSK